MISKNQDFFRNKVTFGKLIKIKRNIFSIFEKIRLYFEKNYFFEIIKNKTKYLKQHDHGIP